MTIHGGEEESRLMWPTQGINIFTDDVEKSPMSHTVLARSQRHLHNKKEKT